MPFGPGGNSQFLRADGTWGTPVAGPGGQAFPVGSLYFSAVATNPATLLGYGTWLQVAQGRMLVGQDGTDPAFASAGLTGGAKTHALTVNEMPAHTHLTMRYPTATGTSTGFTIDTSMSGTPVNNTLETASAGSGSAHNNLPPYLVAYIWQRTE